MGEPFEIESTETWSPWGLDDDAGNLVAVATVVVSSGGWDPNHARYCVLPRPTPPPPFTLYVSNQSSEDLVRLANAAVTACRQRVQQETLEHRGWKGDPLYDVRKLLLLGAERVDDAGWADGEPRSSPTTPPAPATDRSRRRTF